MLCHIEILGVKQVVIHRDTSRFTPRNKLFYTVEEVILHRETKISPCQPKIDNCGKELNQFIATDLYRHIQIV